MFRLSGPDQPADGAGLSRALARGLAECVEPGSREPVVTARGDAWPELERIHVDLTDSRLRTDRSAFGAVAEGEVGPGPVVSELAIRGAPAIIGGTAVTLDLTARDAVFGFAPAGDDVVMARLGHGGGDVRLFVDHAELERVVTAGIAAKAATQGAKVLACEVDLAPAEDNRVDVEIAVTFKMMFKAKIRARGRLRLADDLTLIVEEATVEGDGMAGRTVAGLVKPQVTQLAGKEFAFGSLLPNGVRLADIVLETDGGLGARARIVPEPGEERLPDSGASA